MSARITIVGASVRAAAQSAVRAGYRVRAADLFADVDLRRIAETRRVDQYPQGLGDVLVDTATRPWMYTGALENYPQLIADWQQQQPLWGNGPQVLARVRDPKLLAASLHAAALRAPDVYLEARRAPRDGSWLCKPLRSSGGTQITRWEPRSRESLPPEHYLQRWVDGTPCSAQFVAAAGRACLLGVTEQLLGQAWLGACGFHYCGSIGPLSVSPSTDSELRRIGDVLAKDFGLIGLFGVDAVVNNDGAWAIEVNPRYCASLEVLERSVGFHSIALHGEACSHGRVRDLPSTASSSVCGKAILFVPHRLVLANGADVPWLEDGGDKWPNWADLPAPGSVIPSGGPLLTILDSAPTREATLELLQGRAAHVWQAIQTTAR